MTISPSAIFLSNDLYQHLRYRCDLPADSLTTSSSPSPMPRQPLLSPTADSVRGTEFLINNMVPDDEDLLIAVNPASNEALLHVPEWNASVINDVINDVDKKLSTDSSTSESIKSTSTVVNRKGKGRDPDY